MKILPVGAEFFHADRRPDRQTDMTKLTVAFCIIAKAPKIISSVPLFFAMTDKEKLLK